MTLLIHIVSDKSQIKDRIKEHIDNAVLNGLSSIKRKGNEDIRIGECNYIFITANDFNIDRLRGLIIDKLIIDEKVYLSENNKNYIQSRMNRCK